MSQADQTVQNDTFPTVRADINNNLAALFSNNSGSSAPSVTVAYMDWIDTSGANPVWKKRNAANNAWITLGTIVSNSIAFEGTLPSQSGNSGKYLTTDGTTASWGTITASGQLLRAPQILTSGTSYTTPANCTKIYVELVGGGGGGDYGYTSGSFKYPGDGGGAGAYCAEFFTVSGSVSYTYAIGAGGAGGVGAFPLANPTAGGNTTFTVGGTTLTANGGAGRPGTGGTSSTGAVRRRGESGLAGDNNTGGRGGDSFFDLGGDPGNPGNSGGTGAGGGGGSLFTTARDGGAGGAGLIRIWEYS